MEDLFKEILNLGKKASQNNAKMLSAQFISRYFKHFPNTSKQALGVLIDFCEEDDVQVK
jgi:phosphoheptose isomerase